MSELPPLSGFRVELLHKEILRKLAWHEAQYQRASDGTSSEDRVSATYNIAAHDTLRDIRGLLEACIESERREREIYREAGDVYPLDER
jgi:hypothetical protein